MGIEIERKFLLKDSSWKDQVTTLPRSLEQGYFLRAQGGPTVRVRIADEEAFLTIKGRSKGVEGLERSEFEYAIPLEDARMMLAELCQERVVKKLRYHLPAGNGLVWEIDEYLGLNAGLLTAEIELPSENTDFPRPPWLGEEVSGMVHYTNGALSRCPYSLWKK